ncbi:hypothetical protein BASA50_010896 [Batrachochytrium salamandrivorans]|uniref:Pentacotripeptide-repeat region of PRORP domain-containing protein n=1 Tax=Batrachochytrium salamandrivorans TaxID=1357716 RepID=A0ABQ8EX60_9FUNG|nr:hypothetical protein BASA60_002782 [Batrachochytrium salamandrivorans]KAH6588033.1 hypothetical protein BASA50_010896 [Batrachochytrium salamandrivorans]
MLSTYCISRTCITGIPYDTRARYALLLLQKKNRHPVVSIRHCLCKITTTPTPTAITEILDHTKAGVMVPETSPEIDTITHKLASSSTLTSRYPSSHVISLNRIGGMIQRNRELRQKPEFLQQVPTVANLQYMLDKQNFVTAFGIYKRIEHRDSSELAQLPMSYFVTLSQALRHNTNGMLRSMSSMHRMEMAASVLYKMTALGIRCDFYTLRLSVDIHACCGDIAGAKAAYDQICQQSFDTEEPLLLGYMCKAYLLAGQDAKGLQFFKRQIKVDPTQRPYNMLIKAYAKRNDNVGVLTMLKELNSKQFQIDTTLLAVLCDFYCRRGDYKQALQHMSEFISKGYSMTPALYTLQLKAYNGIGDFQSATDLLSDIRSKHIHVDHSMLLEEIRTHAGMGKPDLMWKAYGMVKSTSNVNERGLAAMAKSIGSLTGTHAVDKIIREATKVGCQTFSVARDLISGYASLGDAGSVKLLISEANKTTRNFSLRVHAEVVRAYNTAGDIDGGLAYAHMLFRMGQHVHIDIWYMVLCGMFEHDHKDVESVVTHIQGKYPRTIVSEKLEQARARANRLRETRKNSNNRKEEEE